MGLNVRWIGELWEYRELFYFLAWRDVKVRYKQTVLGVAWAVLQPLLTMAIFMVLFGKIAKISTNEIPPALFYYVGLVPWIYFSGTLNICTTSLVNNVRLITKVYFPRMIIPASVALSGIMDFLIAVFFIGGFMIYYGIVPNGQLLLLPFLIVLLFAFTYGLGMFLAALTAQFRDVRYATPFFIQLGMFLSPIIYPPSFVSEEYRFWLGLNPLTGIIDSFRAAIVPGQPVQWNLLMLSMLVTAVMLVVGMMYFHKVERTLADVI